jgi:hypothetical protein
MEKRGQGMEIRAFISIFFHPPLSRDERRMEKRVRDGEEDEDENNFFFY